MGDYSTYIEQTFTLEAFTSRKKPTFFTPHFQICFTFYCQPVICDWIRYPGSPAHLLRRTLRPTIVVAADITLLQLLRVDEAHDVITEELKCWPVLEDQRKALVEDALVRALEEVRAMRNMSDNTVGLNVHSTLYQHNFIDGERLIEEEESLLQGRFMVPASESCIESILETKKTMTLDENDYCCSICLDKYFDGGGELVVSMPCSHDFHGECIEKWLRTSHYCPVCRFEMPTES